MTDESLKTFPEQEWAIICRVPSEESAYLYFFLELYEGIFNFSTLDHKIGETSRDLLCITNGSMLHDAKEMIADLKEHLRLEITKDFHLLTPDTIVN